MLTRLRQFHENEQLIGWTQTNFGRLTVWLAGMALLIWHESSVSMLAAFTAVLILPIHRRALLSLAALGTIFERFANVGELSASAQWLTAAAKVTAALAGLYLAFLLIKYIRHWPAIARRHPVVLVHAAIWLALALSFLPGLGPLAAAPFFAWRLSYLAASGARGSVTETSLKDHLFYLVPVFGGEATPIGKGLDYLARSEAADPPTAARSQLAGIKLLLLAFIWILVLAFLDSLIHGTAPTGRALDLLAWLPSWSLGLPKLGALLIEDQPHAWYTGWIVIYTTLIRETLKLAIFGHVVVGCLRLLGFNVFRNTYKPLLAESIVEFWNRFYFYFKEVLVEFFFYPTYLRLRSLSPAARTFAAVFAAAFVGNMYFHILYESPDEVVLLDFSSLWGLWGARLIYCLLLALGIWLSMLRQQKLRAAGETVGPLIRLRRIAGVWTFYAVIQIWNIRMEEVAIADCNALFLALFGLSMG